MGTHDDAPQTVGAALKEGWNFLGVECAHCRRGKTRINLTRRAHSESLAGVAIKCWCRRCGPSIGRAYLTFELISVRLEERRKPIAFNGLVAIKIGMN